MQNAGMNAVISGKYIISDFFYMKVKSQGHQVKMVPIERSCKVICGNMKAPFFWLIFLPTIIIGQRSGSGSLGTHVPMKSFIHYT